jgi:hypothetical protein
MSPYFYCALMCLLWLTWLLIFKYDEIRLQRNISLKIAAQA